MLRPKPNERVSLEHSEDNLQRAMEALPEALLALLGNEVIQAMYGYGAFLHPDVCYKPMKVGTQWLHRFVKDSLDQRIVVPGKSDFIFLVRDGQLEVEFCHDAHVHISGSNLSLVEALTKHPSFAATGFRAV